MFYLIKRIKEKLFSEEVILYLIFGVLTTLVNILLYLAFAHIIKINYIIANILAWFFSVIFAYVTNRIWVFKSKNENIIVEFVMFLCGRLFSGVLDTLLLYLFVGLLFIDDVVAKIVIGVIVVIVNYVLSKEIIFNSKQAGC